MNKRTRMYVGKKLFNLLNNTIKKPFIDALGIYGFVKILSILVDRNFIPHTQYILLMMTIGLFSAITSEEKKQIYTCFGFILSLSLFLSLKHWGLDHWPLWILEIIFILCFIYNVVLYIRKMFEFNYGKSMLPTISFLLIYFSFVFLQPNISTEALEKPIIYFSKLTIRNFISINYKNNHQFDLIFTIWNALTLLLCGLSFRGQFKKSRKKQLPQQKFK